MKKSLLILTLFSCGNLFGQQFSIQELFQLANERITFERKMLEAGNSMVKSEEELFYRCSDSLFFCACSPFLLSKPTNNPYFEEKWEFPSGQIYTLIDIKINNPNNYCSIIDSLRKVSQPINKLSLNGLVYIEGLKTVIKNNHIYITFAKDYNYETQTANIFYSLNHSNHTQPIFPSERPPTWYRQLSIDYADRRDYLKGLKEVQNICQYIGIYKGIDRDDNPYFEIEYDCKDITVYAEEDKNGGGSIRIVWKFGH